MKMSYTQSNYPQDNKYQACTHVNSLSGQSGQPIEHAQAMSQACL